MVQASGQVPGLPEFPAVVLAQRLERDAARRRVDAHGEGLRREQHLASQCSIIS